MFAEPRYIDALRGLDLAEISITSTGTLSAGPAPAGAFSLPEIPGVAVIVGAAPGDKCQRWWRILAEVGVAPASAELCLRCSDAVRELAPTAGGG